MRIITSSIERIGFKVGLVTFALLVAYFFVMKTAGLAFILQYRYFNFFILLGGIWYAINSYKKKNLQQSSDDFYLAGMGEGMFTGGVAVFLFSVFIGAYLDYIDPAFMEQLKLVAPLGSHLDALTVFLVLSGEGIGSALIITFGLMQYYKYKMYSKLNRNPEH